MASKQVHIPALPHQAELFNDWTPGAFIGVVGGLGSGKTYGLITKTILCHLMHPGYASMLVEPTFRLCVDTLVPTWHVVCREHFPWLKYRYKRGDMVIELPQLRGLVLLRSADEPIKLRGPNLGWVGIDEPGQMDLEGFEDAAGRARVGPLQQVYLTGTPEGLNWFADKFDEPEKPYKTIRAGVRHPSLGENYEQKLKDIYKGQHEKLQAYLNGEFVQLFEGAVYPTFSRNNHVKSQVLDSSLPLILACDFNINPLAWVVIQQDGDITRVIDEISYPGTTEEATQEFLRRYKRQDIRHGEIHIYGDRSGKSGSTRSRETDYQIMRRLLNAAHFSVANHTPDSNPPVIDRVNVVTSRLANGQVLIDPSCKGLIRSLLKTTWKKNTRAINKPSNDTWTHFADGLGYYLHERFPITGRTIVSTGLNKRVWVPNHADVQLW